MWCMRENIIQRLDILIAEGTVCQGKRDAKQKGQFVKVKGI